LRAGRDWPECGGGSCSKQHIAARDIHDDIPC
jgi:hypothetical protein